MRHPHAAGVVHAGQDVADLEAEIPVRAWLGLRHGQWNAIAVDYTVVGVGDSPEDAIKEMLELLADYLEATLSEDVLLEDARRPLPWRWRLELDAIAAVHKLLPTRSSEPRKARAVEVPLPRDLHTAVGC